MIQLNADESRVLGVLIEKAQTVPGQYPMTLNGMAAGANQKNNRDPVTELDEDRVLAAVDGLRGKGLVLQVDLSGSRVLKWRHIAREALAVQTPGLVILAELLLRGPQTLGELRGRASRMHPLESLEVTQSVLQSLMERPEPLVRQLDPLPGSRAERYVQLLCPNLHPIDPGVPRQAGAYHPAAEAPAAAADPKVLERISDLEGQVAALRRGLQKLAASLGEELEE